MSLADIAEFYRLVSSWSAKAADSIDAAIGAAAGPVLSTSDLDLGMPETMTMLRHLYTMDVLFLAADDSRNCELSLIDCLWRRREALAADTAVSSCERTAMKLDALDALLVRPLPDVFGGDGS